MGRSYRRVGLLGAVLVGIVLMGAVAMAQETARGGGAADLASVYRAIGLGAAAAFAAPSAEGALRRPAGSVIEPQDRCSDPIGIEAGGSDRRRARALGDGDRRASS